jgi:hypothetical protein
MITLPNKHFFSLIGGLVLAVLITCAGVSWLREHDARIIAEQTVKASEARVQDLQGQREAVQKQADATLAALRKQAEAVKTPSQAIAAIPDVSTLPLNSRPVPSAPEAVQVDALPLFQELSACKQTAVSLTACQSKLDLTEKIADEKDAEVKALKKPRGFWKRLATTVKDVGIGVAIGYGLHAVTTR